MSEIVRAITCGEPVGSVAATGFTVTDVKYAPGDAYAWHVHEHAYLMLVCGGGFYERTPRQVVELTSGSVIVVPAGYPHDDVIARTGARGLLVTLEPSFARAPRNWSACQGGAVSRAMIALHHAYRMGGGSETLAIEERLLEATAQIPDGVAEPRETRAVRIAREMIEAYPTEPLRFRDVARAAGVNASYLARAFRRCIGRTMSAHLRSVRARRAAAMLASGNKEVAEIALASGFADQSHLCRVFKAEYGMTPRHYRQLTRR